MDLVVATVVCFAISALVASRWIDGRVATRAMAQLEEGYRQALCAQDEFQNKLMAMADLRAHATYRQAAGPLGKPPMIRSHDAPASALPPMNGALPNPAAQSSIIAAQQQLAVLEERERRLGTVRTPSGYGEEQEEP